MPPLNKEKPSWLTKGMADTDDADRDQRGILAKYLCLAVAVNIIPLERGGSADGRGRLSYRPLSATSVRGFLLWLQLPNIIIVTALAYMFFNEDLWEAFSLCMTSNILDKTVDTISLSLTNVALIAIVVFLPGILAALLADIQDLIPMERMAWPQARDQGRPWLPLLAAILIAPCMVMEVLFLLPSWLDKFSDVSTLAAFGRVGNSLFGCSCESLVF